MVCPYSCIFSNLNQRRRPRIVIDCTCFVVSFIFYIHAGEEVFTVRFDALLVTPTQLANRILPVPVAKPTDGGEIPLEINETNAWQEQRAEDARKVISAATDTLRRAPDPVYDEMEAEMVLAAGRGARAIEDEWGLGY